MIPIAIKTPEKVNHMCVVVATKKDNKVNFKIFDPSKALKLEDRERVKQIFGDYIYDNLDKENYILSPEKAIQDELTNKSQLFKGTCTGISTEYINYMIDTKQKAKKLTEQQGEVIQERYATDVTKNGLHHIVSGEQQIEQQAVKQETKPQDKPSVEKKKTAIEDNLVKKYSNRPINIPTLPRPPKKKTIPESKPVIDSKQVKQDKVVDKDEVKPEAIPVKNTDIDKKPIKEEITVRNAPVEKSKQYFIKTEFANGKLNMSLIEYKTEEHNKDFAKFYNDNHILFTKGADGYGCLFEEDTVNKIINDNTTKNTYNNIFIYTDNKYVSKNEYIQKKKEEEQKRQEEEQKKKGSSSMESLKNIDKDNQVKETSKESSGLWSNFIKYFSKKSTDNEKQTLLNTPEEQKPSKSSWWSGKKKKTTEKCKQLS